jgi:hypothetical protein
MSATILGVELTFDDDAGGLYYAETPVGSVCLRWREVESPAVEWHWDLSVSGECYCQSYRGEETWQQAAVECDRALSRLLAIGRAQGLREAAGIAHERTSLHAAFGRDPHPADRNVDVREDLAIEASNIEALITAAAERAERGGGG